VTLTDVEGISHTVEVSAESLYEAAALALRELRQEPWVAALPPHARFDISVTAPAIHHTVALRAVEQWLREPARSPEEKLRKARLAG
jgi:hypothetical protein